MITNKLKPKTLDQILEVIKITKSCYSGGDTKTSSLIGINNVSKNYEIWDKTVRDGVTRRLDKIKINDFRDMLIDCFNGYPNKIISVLKEHTDYELHCKIDEFFRGLIRNKENIILRKKNRNQFQR